MADIGKIYISTFNIVYFFLQHHTLSHRYRPEYIRHFSLGIFAKQRSILLASLNFKDDCKVTEYYQNSVCWKHNTYYVHVYTI